MLYFLDGERVWLGGHRYYISSSWFWDSDGLTVSWSKWGPSYSNSELCMYAVFDENGFWYDKDCDHDYSVLCQWEPAY